MRKLLQGLFVLLLIVPVAIAQERTFKTSVIAMESHKHPPKYVEMKNLDIRTAAYAYFEFEPGQFA